MLSLVYLGVHLLMNSDVMSLHVVVVVPDASMLFASHSKHFPL
jgi:hypothetical protein